MDCPRCQTPNPATASRCRQCDTSLEVDTPTIDNPSQPSGESDPRVGNWSSSVTAPSSSDSPSSVVELGPGSLLAGRYDIVSRLGGGGMGTVYKAKDREVDRLVALKVIRPELAGNSAILSRFKQELILARKVTQKNVIRIFDLGRDSGMRFITMEYIEGEDLRSVVKQQGRLSPQTTIDIIQQVCLALEAAHGEGVVHRDLKPQNIMIDGHGKVFVMDFGIARSVGSEGMTMTGALVGTPEYMSPEQVKGEHVDGRSDIFSLGIIFYELLTGKMPFRAETAQQSMYRRTVERPTPASSEESSVPAFLSEVVSKCLEIDPSKRFQSAREIWDELDRWCSGKADRPGLSFRRWARSTSTHVATRIAAGVLLVFLLGGVFLHWFSASSPAASAVASSPSLALAIFPFRNASGDPQLEWLGTSLGEMLSNDIGQSTRLRIVSAGRVSQVMQDRRIGPDTQLDSSTLDRLGEFVNADLIISGEYVKFGGQLRIDATLADHKSGSQVQLRANAASEKDILTTVDLLAKQIRQNLSLSSGAIKELQKTAFKPSSSSLEALRNYEQGLQSSRLGKNLQALEFFSSATAQDPEFALAYSKLGETYLRLGQGDRATNASLKAINLSENLPAQEKYRVRATNAKVLGEYPKAIEAYQFLAKASPGDTDILYELASLYENSGDLAQAAAALERVHNLDPRRIDILLAQGRVQIKTSNPQKGLEHLATALNLAIQAGNEEQKADILQAIGVGYADMHRLDEALRSYEDSLAIKRRLNLKSGAATSLNTIANVQNALGKSDLALKNFNESLEIRREIGDKAGIGDVLIDLGTFYVDRGQPDEALNLYKQSLQIQVDLSNEQNRALLLNNIGNIYLGQGDYQDARTYFEQALQLREKFNASEDLAETLHNLAETSLNMGLYDQALDRYHRALDLQRKVGNRPMIAIETTSLGTVFGYQGRYGAAVSAKEEALKTYRELGERSFWMAEILAGYGNALAQISRKDEASTTLQEALILARELKNQDEIARIQDFQGDNAYYSGELKLAQQFYTHALQSAAHSKDRSLVLTIKFNLARVLVEEGHPQIALPTLAALGDEANRSGLKYLSAQCSLYAAQALIRSKNYSKAEESLQNAAMQSEKLGLLALKAQGHAMMAQVLQGEGKSADAERERKTARQVLADIQKEAHFDPQSRHDFSDLLS